MDAIVEDGENCEGVRPVAEGWRDCAADRRVVMKVKSFQSRPPIVGRRDRAVDQIVEGQTKETGEMVRRPFVE